LPWACLAAVVVLLSATAWTLFRRSQREVRAAAPSPDVPVAVAAPAAPVAPVQSVPEPIPAPLVPVQSIAGAFGGRVTGSVIFTASDRVCVATLGGNTVRDLGPGTFARWGPDGRAIAVVHDGGVEVMGTDGSERRRLVRAGVNEPACPIEFHPNGREILFCVDGGGLRSVEIATGRVRDWKIPFEREIGISQDGRRLAGRHRKDLCSAEMPFDRLRKYADGCSSGISPDGLWLLANRGDHKSISLTPFEGGSPRILRAQGLEPDPKWDNQTW